GLRINPDARADTLLSERLLQDPSPEVRQGAVFAAGFRPIGPALPALTKALTLDQDSGVRMDIVRLVGEKRAEIPDAAAILALAKVDPSTEIRQTAQGYLDAIAQQKTATR